MRSLAVRLLSIAALMLVLAAGAASANASTVAIEGDPSATSEAFGGLDVFARGSDGHLYHQSLNGSWWGWADLGQPSVSVTIVGKPSAISWGTGHVDVFARGSDDGLYHRFFQNGGWYPWVRLGGSTRITTSPKAIAWSSGRADVFARGAADQNGGVQPELHAWFQNGYSIDWSGLESLGGDIGSSASVISWGVNHLDVFVRGADGYLYHKYWDGVSWNGWSPLGGGHITDGTAPNAVTWGSGTIQVFFNRAEDNHLINVPFVNGYGGWAAAQDFGGVITSSPTSMTWFYGHTDVFARGTDGRVYHRWMNASLSNNWWPWEAVSDYQYTAGDPAVYSFGNGYADLFARDGNIGLAHAFWSTNVWSGWGTLGHPADRDLNPPTNVAMSGELVGRSGGTVADRGYNLHVSATDDYGVNRIEAYANGSGTPFATIPGGVGDVTFDARTVGLGDNSVRIRAVDNAGNSTWSGTVSFWKQQLDEVSDRDGEREADATPTTPPFGGPCGTGTDTTCPSATERAAFGTSIEDNRTATLRSATPALQGKKVFTDTSQWLGLSENHAGSATTAMNRIGGSLTYFRVIVPWNISLNPASDKYTDLKNYIAAIRGIARHILVSFQISHEDEDAPSVADYTTAVNNFIHNTDFAGVEYYTAWNEPNHSAQPTHIITKNGIGQFGAVVAAWYYRALDGLCHTAGCNVLAGDFSDGDGGARFWDYLSTYRRIINDTTSNIGVVGSWRPRIDAWAVHLHREANLGTYDSNGNSLAKWFDSFISQTGDSTGLPIWITEVGAKSWQTKQVYDSAGNHVKNADGSDKRAISINLRSPSDQTYVVNRRWWDIIDNLAHRSRRVTRLFYYHWQGDNAWDSGIIDLPAGTVFNPAPSPVIPATGADRPVLFIQFYYFNHLDKLTDHPVTGPAGRVASRSAHITFDAQLAGGTNECSIDGGAWTACTSPVDYTGLADGTHKFLVRTVLTIDADNQLVTDPVDLSGDTRSSSLTGVPGASPTKQGEWTVDMTAPDTTLSSPPSGATSQTTQSLSFTSPDSDATSYTCRLDAAAWAACTSPASLTGLTPGTHTFQVRAQDDLGNVDATPATATWLVDTAAPDTTISSAPAALVASASASFSFTGTDDHGVSYHQCQLDAGAWATCSSPSALTGLAQGSHTYRVRAVDAAGNVDATPATKTWVVDTVAPDTTISSGPSGSTSATTASIVFTGSDATGVTAYECKLDSGAWAACTSPKSLTGLASGAHTFSVRAKDGAGNVDASPATASWTVTSLTVLLGNQTIESKLDSNPVGSIEGWPFTAASSGTAVSVTAYLDPTSTATNLKVGLYSNGSSKPGTLLASGSVTNPGAGAWVTVPLSATTPITAGTTYWLGLMTTAGSIQFRDHQAGGSCTGHASGSGLTAPPSTWGADVYSGSDCPGSIYLNGN